MPLSVLVPHTPSSANKGITILFFFKVFFSFLMEQCSKQMSNLYPFTQPCPGTAALSYFLLSAFSLLLGPPVIRAVHSTALNYHPRQKAAADHLLLLRPKDLPLLHKVL